MSDTDQLPSSPPSSFSHRILEEQFVNVILKIAHLKCELFRRRHQNGMFQTNIACQTLSILEGTIHLLVRLPTNNNLLAATETLRTFERENAHLFSNPTDSNPTDSNPTDSNPTDSNPTDRNPANNRSQRTSFLQRVQGVYRRHRRDRTVAQEHAQSEEHNGPLLGILRPSHTSSCGSRALAGLELNETSTRGVQYQLGSRTPRPPETCIRHSRHASGSSEGYSSDDFTEASTVSMEADRGSAGCTSDRQQQHPPRDPRPAPPYTHHNPQRRSLHQSVRDVTEHATRDRPQEQTSTPRPCLRRSESEPPIANSDRHLFGLYHHAGQHSWEHSVAKRRRRILLEATQHRIIHMEALLEDIREGPLREIFSSLWRHFRAVRNVLEVDDALLEGGDISALLESPIGTPPPPYTP